MKTTLKLLAVGVSSAIMLVGSPTTVSAQGTAPAPPEPIVIARVTGSANIHQTLPARCGEPVDITLRVTGGRIDISHFVSDGIDWFDLMRLDMSLEPFEVGRNCDGIIGTASFGDVGFRLANTLRFPGVETGRISSGLFTFSIPKEQFLIYETVLDNQPVRQPDAGYERPSQDVTGLIDLRSQTVAFHVAIATQVHFRAGCTRRGCLIDQTISDGTQTADITGETDACHAPAPSVAPRLLSPTPLTASCTLVDAAAQTFQVGADEGCNKALAIHLGAYVVANGEVIRIQPSSRPGVRLLNSTVGGLRQFQVGPGDGVVIATDGTNTARAVCQ